MVPRTKTWYNFHINCGGKAVTVGNTKYEQNRAGSSASKFYLNWAFGSTGHFLDGKGSPDDHIYQFTSQKNSTLNVSDLYMDARLSPNSLTYYGFCLGNGKYTVSLHFAKIMVTDDKTYNSLRRRVFNIYIQGVLVLNDFNIADNAFSAGKEYTKRLPAAVTNNTSAIRFQWAGKGTTSIPARGIYGPLISAISFTPAINVNLIVESDSTTAISWFTGNNTPPWKFWSAHNSYINAIEKIKEVSFVHTFRENNSIVDYLAKNGAENVVNFEEWFV